MRPSLVLNSAENRQAIRAAVKARRGLNPRVFGSALHGTDQENSDLDVLIDEGPGMTTLDVTGLRNDLSDLLGVAVDVCPARRLRKNIRAQIIESAQAI